MSVLENLNAVLVQSSGSSAQMDSFKTLIVQYVKSGDVASLKQVVDIILDDSTSSQFSVYVRPILQQIALQMEKLGNHLLKELSQHVLGKLQGMVVSFEEEDFIIREHLADVLQADCEFSEAARCLAQLNLETGTRARTSAEKVEKYVRICELYLEDGDPVEADMYCSRARLIVHEVENMPDQFPLVLRFRVCCARILDARRKFADAAQRYYELSQQTFNGQIDQNDLQQLLENSMICTILAESGSSRSRLLAALAKDERVEQGRAAHSDILIKMFMGRLISKEELTNFESALQDHQKATDREGMSVLDKAALQHNLAATSLLYKNIFLEDLGRLLGVTAKRAEKVVAKMIAEKRLAGTIDQKSQLLHFEAGGEEGESARDRHVRAVCTGINRLLENVEPINEIFHQAEASTVNVQ